MDDVIAAGEREVAARWEEVAHDFGLDCDLDRVDAHLGGKQIDGPFEGGNGFGAACPTKRTDGGRVGEDCLERIGDLADVVATLGHHPGEEWKKARPGGGVASVDEIVEVIVGDAPIGATAHRDRVVLGAAVAHRLQVFGARLDPQNRALHDSRQTPQGALL